jgi:alpha/beta hydrolase family protein
MRLGIGSAMAAVVLAIVGMLLFGAAPADAQLAGWRAERVGGRPLPDPERASPAEIARLFTRTDGSALAARYPRLVGNLDGTPPSLRYAVNAAQAGGRPRQLLGYDRSGDGRLVEVFGDLMTADRIAVLVPGVDNTALNFDRLRGGRHRRTAAAAPTLYNQAAKLRPGARVAVVAWLGYDAPEGLGREAFREERAAAGARALVRFVDGLAAYRPAAAITVIGHSYGSVVVGLAARSLNPQVRDIVAVASPGMGVDRLGQLHTRARVWAGTAGSDWVRRLPAFRFLGVGHGAQPSAKGFGALPLPVDGVAGHYDYFRPGTGSLRAMASITLGAGWAVAPRG